MFGIKLEEGPPICSTFEVRGRPYIGTTTMDAVSSHISANAARILPGFSVLDPFCGTGSLLLSSAYLGADVVGTDIDADCLGLLDLANITYKERSKNARFKRRNKDNGEEWDQLHGNAQMNFAYYGLESKLSALISCSIEAWAEHPSASVPALDKYPLFDAIVTDPPFGRRERVTSGSGNQEFETKLLATNLGGFHKDSMLAVVMLLVVAMKRLKPGGRLVFWLPTEASLTSEQVRDMLVTYEDSARAICNVRSSKLVFEGVKPQELNFGVWRWLVRYSKSTQ